MPSSNHIPQHSGTRDTTHRTNKMAVPVAESCRGFATQPLAHRSAVDTGGRARSLFGLLPRDRTRASSGLRRVRENRECGFSKASLVVWMVIGVLLHGGAPGHTTPLVPGGSECPVDPSNSNVVTCSGDLSPGIRIDSSEYDTLILENVEGDGEIRPESGSSGIFFKNSGAALTVTTDPNGVDIFTSGEGAHGIDINAHQRNGTVVLNHWGNIETDGSESHGINAIGTASVIHHGDITTKQGDSHGIYVQVKGDSDELVYVEHYGNIETQSFNSSGIYIYDTNESAATVIQKGIIRTQGTGIEVLTGSAFNKAGGEINITHTGEIYSHSGGDHFDKSGIRASIGFNSGDHNGTDTITVRQTGVISSTGVGSRGITAEHSGLGAVNVFHTGTIRANTYGIALGLGNGNKTVTLGLASTALDGSTITGSTITSANAIWFGGTGNNVLNLYNEVKISGSVFDILGENGDETIHNYGTFTSTGNINLGGGNDTIHNYGTLNSTGNISLGNGNDTIHNYGTFNSTRNINLGNGHNAFNNYGLFNSGTEINLGNNFINEGGNLFTNEGTLSPGGHGVVQKTDLTGNFLQTDTGILAIDIDVDGGTHDQLDMGGTGTADLSGGVAVNFLNSLLTEGQGFTILNDASAVTQLDLELININNLDLINPVVTATFEVENDEEEEDAKDVIMTIGYDFAPDGLNRNQTALGTHLTDLFYAEAGGLDSVFTSLANMLDLPSVAGALDQLSPEVYVDTQMAALFASQAFSDQLLSCRVNGEGRSFINKEGECWWMNATGRFLSRDRTFEMIGYDETVGSFAAGRQLALGPVWRLSVGAGYQHSWLSTNTNATSDSNQIQGGLALKYNPGALLLAAAVNGGYGWYDTTRPMAFGTVDATAQGKQDINMVAARLYGSYVVGAPQLFVKPILSAAATRLSLGSLTENGAGAANLQISGETETIYSLSPALEAGTQGWIEDRTLVRPFVRAGMTWFSQDDISATATFVDSPSGVSPFSVVTTMDHLWADVAGGLEFITAKNTNVRLYYDGRLSDAITIHSLGLKVGITF